MERNAKINNLSMLDDYEVQGYWWLPDQKDNQLAGNLYYENQKINLHVLGSFSNEIIEHDYIHGITIKGEEITLFNNKLVNGTINMPGFPSQQFTAMYFIVGDHITDIDEIKFRSVNISSTYLTKWFNNRPFHTEDKLDEESNLINQSNTFIAPEVHSVYVKSIDAEICNNYNFNQQSDSVTKMNLKYREFLKITPDEWQDFDWYRKNINKLNRLLSLFVGEPVYLERMVLEGEIEDTGFGEDFNETKKYHVYFSQREVKVNEKLISGKMLFTYPEVKQNLGVIFDNWFEKESYLNNVLNLYFGDIYNGNVDLETKFLNAVQTLEVYHRNSGYGKLFSDEEKDKDLNIINEALTGLIPDDKLAAINSRLKYYNDYSLVKRLEDIVKDKLNNDTKEYLFKSNTKAGSFIFKSANTRNYLTHYDETSQEKRFVGVEMFYATKLLKALSGILLLKELGIDESIALNKAKTNHSLSQLIAISKKELNFN
ncbi:HEPN domain-containing protein [Guptibacillus hwajinpoensis]|uniref:ApeA N-terminal domain 1-containing protein n=1 Tax=Guptibacillus hwajinpoensis TaxID=208199 RepID=UPI0024B399B1|nr:HEPN domain-containing protein [Pseudalkalibacillus hwajinpoensis]